MHQPQQHLQSEDAVKHTPRGRAHSCHVHRTSMRHKRYVMALYSIPAGGSDCMRAALGVGCRATSAWPAGVQAGATLLPCFAGACATIRVKLRVEGTGMRVCTLWSLVRAQFNIGDKASASTGSPANTKNICRCLDRCSWKRCTTLCVDSVVNRCRLHTIHLMQQVTCTVLEW